MRYLLTLSLIGLFSIVVQAQSKFKEINTNVEVKCYYKIKALKDDQNRIILKFKNESEMHQNINLKLGLYLNGVMEEEAIIATCQKKGFFSNLFTRKHAIINEQISEKQLLSEDFSIEILKIELEETTACEKAHS